MGAGGEAAPQSGLIGGRAAVEEAGRWVGARRKVTVAPPTQSENSHGSTSGLPESRVLGIRQDRQAHFSSVLGEGEDFQGPGSF